MNTFEIQRNKQNPEVMPKDAQPQNPFGAYGKCPKCGIELHNVMSYSCDKTDCPTGLGNKVSM